MIFDTTINGIPCQCQVREYHAYIPPRITGSGYGDIDPPDEECFDFAILDRKGHAAPWLHKYLTPEDEVRLMKEYLAHCREDLCSA